MSNSNLEKEKDFVAIASHELRSPIAIIRGFAEVLQDLPKMNPEMVRDISEKILRNSLRLEKVMKSLLLITDLENLASTSFQQVKVLPLIQHCKEMVLERYPESNIVIECHEPDIYVMAEADLLELAIINLLENAIKYSSAPAFVHVSLSSDVSLVTITVQDQGIGIAPEHLPYICDRFYSADKARSRKLGGAGLGLSLVKTIIEKHEGSISVQSERGKGSVFTVVLQRSA